MGKSDLDVLFVTTGSNEIGWGHQSRCRVLWKTANENNLTTAYILISNSKTLPSLNAKVVVIDLPISVSIPDIKVDIFVYLDRYPVATRSENISVIDTNEYLIPTDKFKYYSGPKYAIVDKQFTELRMDHKLENFVNYGVLVYIGTDFASKKITEELMEAIVLHTELNNINVITNIHMVPFTDRIKIHSPKEGLFLSLLKRSNLVITKTGQTMWETLAAGRACVCIEKDKKRSSIHKNQANKYESDWPPILCDFKNPKEDIEIIEYLTKIDYDVLSFGFPPIIQALGMKGSNFIDGNGAQRIIDIIKKEIENG